MITDEGLMAYLDGEAPADQVRAIEAALSANPALRARLVALESRDQTVRDAFDELLDRPVPAALVDAVRKGADADVVPLNLHRQARSGSLGAALAALRRRPMAVALAVAAQAAVIAVTATVALNMQRSAPSNATSARADYIALGAAPKSSVANLMIIFDPKTPEGDMRAALNSVQARIVGGPTAAGAYLVQTPAAGRDAAVRSLQARDEVVMAQPLDSGRP